MYSHYVTMKMRAESAVLVRAMRDRITMARAAFQDAIYAPLV